MVRIIVAEDNRADAMLVEMALSEAGIRCELETVQDGEQAIELLDRLDRDESAPVIDLLLADLNLPKLSGEEVVAHLRSTRRNTHAPAILMSGSTLASDVARSERFANTRYFQKPSSLTEFLTLGTLVRSILVPNP